MQTRTDAAKKHGRWHARNNVVIHLSLPAPTGFGQAHMTSYTQTPRSSPGVLGPSIPTSSAPYTVIHSTRFYKRIHTLLFSKRVTVVPAGMETVADVAPFLAVSTMLGDPFRMTR